MRGNSAFSGLSGLLFILQAEPIGDFSSIPSELVTIVGLLLTVYAVLLLFASSSHTSRYISIARFAIWMDWLWVATSVIAVTPGLLPITDGGRFAILLLALIVAFFALAQQRGLRQLYTR